MAIEEVRGCGYRLVNGLYLRGDGIQFPCVKMPYKLHSCPTCGTKVHQTRSYREITKPFQMFNNIKDCPKLSPIDFKCNLANHPCPFYTKELSYLMFVGAKFYTPDSFIREAFHLGVSKRIPTIPKDLILGETWVFLAHPKAYILSEPDEDGKTEVPGVFYAFIPQKIEKLYYESDVTHEVEKECKELGITIIKVPDGDKDHASDSNYKPVEIIEDDKVHKLDEYWEE